MTVPRKKALLKICHVIQRLWRSTNLGCRGRWISKAYRAYWAACIWSTMPRRQIYSDMCLPEVHNWGTIKDLDGRIMRNDHGLTISPLLCNNYKKLQMYKITWAFFIRDFIFPSHFNWIYFKMMALIIHVAWENLIFFFVLLLRTSATLFTLGLNI